MSAFSLIQWHFLLRLARARVQISNVLLCLVIDSLNYAFHTLGNLVFAAGKYVLVNDNEVCGFGVVRNLPLAL